MRKFAMTAALICIALLAVSALADYQAGLDAYQSGDYDRAFKEWIAILESNPNEVDPDMRAETCYALGMLYWVGQGVPQNSERSAYWLKQAAELNHLGAQTKLGFLYSTGDGVPQSHFEAFKWFQMAANQGDPDAQYNLGVYYREGLGVKADGTEALKWFRKAAANGDAESATIVAQYEAGVPVTGERASNEPIANTEMSPEPKAIQEASPGQSMLPGNVSSMEQPADKISGENWISEQEPEHYTIQVIGLRDRNKLQGFIDTHPEWAPWAIYRQTLKGEPLWVLIQGDYAEVELARAARDQFPADVQKRDQLWIRRFKMVQGILLL